MYSYVYTNNNDNNKRSRHHPLSLPLFLFLFIFLSYLTTMNHATSGNTNKKRSVLSELFLVSKAVYYTLLSKVSDLERSEIEALNRQTLIDDDDEAAHNIGRQQTVPPMLPPPAPEGGGGGGGGGDVESTSVPISTSLPPTQVPEEGDKEEVQQQQQQDGNMTFNEASVDPLVGEEATTPPEHVDEAVVNEPAPTTAAAATSVQEEGDSQRPSFLPKDAQPLPQPKTGKRGHHFPHKVVTLKSNPESVTTVIPREDAIRAASAVVPPPTPPPTATATKPPSGVVKTSKSKVFKCPLCPQTFKAEYARFRHITSMHDSSEEAKNEILRKHEREKANRLKLSNGKKQQKLKNEVDITSTENKPALRRSSRQQGQKTKEKQRTEAQSGTIVASAKAGDGGQLLKTSKKKTSTGPGKAKPIAGKKRARSTSTTTAAAEGNPVLKIIRGSATKRKAGGTLATTSTTSRKKVKLSELATNKRQKLHRRAKDIFDDRTYDETVEDDTYDDW